MSDQERIEKLEARCALQAQLLVYLSRYVNSYPCSCTERIDPNDKGTYGRGLIRCYRCYALAKLKEIA